MDLPCVAGAASARSKASAHGLRMIPSGLLPRPERLRGARELLLLIQMGFYPARSVRTMASRRRCGCGETEGTPSPFCGLRQLSRMATLCAQATVQSGAHHFSVLYSRSMSFVVYSASGTPGVPRCCEQ